MKTFTENLILILKHKSITRKSPKLFAFLLELYEDRPKFWNFGLIGLIGMGINQIILHLLIVYLPLWLANFCGILIAWVWNYHNAIGKLSKYWG